MTRTESGGRGSFQERFDDMLEPEADVKASLSNKPRAPGGIDDKNPTRT
jgi:hypothetical protein